MLHARRTVKLQYCLVMTRFQLNYMHAGIKELDLDLGLYAWHLSRV